MSPKAVLKAVKAKYPELDSLPKARLRLVEQAILFASQMVSDGDLLSSQEHADLMRKIEPQGDMTPGRRLRAYRFREELTQQELARLSGISQANISAMEKDRRPLGLNVAKKLADILGCDFKRLI